MKPFPKKARMYFLGAAFMFALPAILSTFHRTYEGQFLVAMGSEHDPNFGGTVIYITYHNLRGAQGVIINKPLSDNDPRPATPIEKEEGVTILRGGPVDLGSKWFYLGGWPFVLTEYKALEQSLPQPRIYTGYAGWHPLQLDVEVMKGYWGIIDYDSKLMFHTPPEQIWDRAMEKVLKERPADPGGV